MSKALTFTSIKLKILLLYFIIFWIVLMKDCMIVHCSGGYKLPVIPDHEPGSPDGRLSSDTYIAQDSVPLSTIQVHT